MTGSSRTPLWKSIFETLKNEIGEHIYRDGDKLPTEAALASRFGVNRHTVRRALKQMADEGLVRSRRGAGVFVTATPTIYPLGRRARFHQSVMASGQAPEKRVLQIERRGATQDEAERLEINPGAPVCVYHGISLADTTPIALFQSYFPEDRLPGIASILADETRVTAALNKCGVSDFVRSHTWISARLADATQAAHLHVSEGSPLVYSTSVSVDNGGHPVELGRTWFAGDRVTLTLGDSPKSDPVSRPVVRAGASPHLTLVSKPSKD